jgi:hypothetical protein
MRNPQAFQQVNQLLKSNGSPNEMINQIIKGYKPEQIANFKKYANGFGIANEELEKFGIK